MRDCKFNLGDIVATKSALAESICGRYPKAFTILEQTVVTCPGGTQIYYLIRVEELAKFAEEELVRWTDPAVPAAIDVANEYHDRREERRTARWAKGIKESIAEKTEPE